MPYLMVAPERPLHLDLYRNPSLFSYARQAGYHTSFVYANENDWDEFVDGEIDVVRRSKELAPGSGRWTFDTDAAMLPSIADLANRPGRQFLVVETYTSHWPYGDRYRSCPQCRVFRPDIPHGPAPFSEAFRPKIVNSYDNAILYFDRFAASLIGGLKKPTLVVVTSDHGESLGEGGMWGHCSGAVEQMLVPLIIIATDARVAKAAGFEQLARVVDAPVSHANIFPTLLGYFGYDVRDLELPYATSLDALDPRGEADRAVLTSEIGTGVEPVSFAHLDGARVITRREEVEDR
jgi:glucan phosphoethanolaminetransferase (alkaline phosphatase superfamily)